MVRTGGVLVSVAMGFVACGSEPPKRIAVPTPVVAADATMAAVTATLQPTTARYVVVINGQRAGTYDITSLPDGTRTTRGGYISNGRGPQVETTQRVGADGTLVSYVATGTYEFGTAIAESFTRTGTTATWVSDNAPGKRELTGPALFVSNAYSPETPPMVVRAALANGGRIALLPFGEARVESVADHTVSVGGATKHVVCYATTGMDMSPLYAWLEDDGTLFGILRPIRSLVPEGWESTIDVLLPKQQALEEARVGELAKLHAHRPPAAGLAYTHARVLDVKRGAWLQDQTVVVVGDAITAVGPSARTKVPAGAEVVDLAGKGLLPGLIDMHAHMNNTGGILNIASGVTTVRDVGNEMEALTDLKQRFDAGSAIGPHIIRFGRIEGVGPKALRVKVTATTPEEAAAAVELYVSKDYDGIKIYNSIKPELVPVITRLAHAKGMQVTGHIPAFMLAEDAVNAGYDGIEHMNMVFLNFVGTRETDTRDLTRFTLVGENGGTVDLKSKRVRDFIALLRKKHVVVDPTFVVFEGKFLIAEPGKFLPDQERVGSRLPALSQRFLQRDGVAISDKVAEYRAAWQRMLELAKALHDAKVHVVLGTDSIAGLMLHHEMKLFAQAGFSNATILELATLGNARAMTLDAKIGSIARGKRADLVVIDGDPLAKLDDIERVVSTMRAGVVYPSVPLYEAVGVRP